MERRQTPYCMWALGQRRSTRRGTTLQQNPARHQRVYHPGCSVVPLNAGHDQEVLGSGRTQIRNREGDKTTVLVKMQAPRFQTNKGPFAPRGHATGSREISDVFLSCEKASGLFVESDDGLAAIVVL